MRGITTMTRAAALALLLAAAGPAAAQVAPQASAQPAQAATEVTADVTAPPGIPTLKRAATVTAEIVRIGDLIDNAGPVSNTPIFRSPDVGTTGSVSIHQVFEAVRPHHLYLIDTGGLSEVEVTRSGRTIEIADIEARIARAFAGRYGLGDVTDLAVTLDAPARPVTVEASATGELAVAAAAFDPRSGRFDVSFALPGSRVMRRPLRLTGTVVETVVATVTTRPLARGETIKTSDVATERRPKATVGADAVGSVDEAIGLAVRQPTRSGQPLRRADLMKSELVRRDDNITLVYEVPGILLTTQGKALESGAEGDVINVLNVQSKRTIQGVVSGPNRVTIMATKARITSAAAIAVPRSIASR
jgi:flagellar basal body P-ring formation protein FlgA